LSYTLWVYEPNNSHTKGDGWNGEDLSIFSFDDARLNTSDTTSKPSIAHEISQKLKPDDKADDRGDLLAEHPTDLRTLVKLGARGITGWCRPYPVEVMGKIRFFEFDLATTKFEVKIYVPGYEESGLWQASSNGKDVSDRRGEFENHKGDDVVEGSSLLYIPFVHYLRGVSDEGSGKGRLIGQPGDDGAEWEQGRGPAVVDLDIVQISEGRLEVKGQWATWYYPLRADGGREIYLNLRKHT
jgi:hypothetical protein